MIILIVERRRGRRRQRYADLCKNAAICINAERTETVNHAPSMTSGTGTDFECKLRRLRRAMKKLHRAPGGARNRGVVSRMHLPPGASF